MATTSAAVDVDLPAPTEERLFTRDFTLMWSGQLLSQLGTAAHVIAITFFIKHATGSAAMLGSVLGAVGMIGVLLSPVGGVIADRFERRQIIIACDVISATATLALAASLYLLPASATHTGVAVALGCGIVVAAVGAFFRPAVGAILPELVPRSQLRAANSLYRSGFKFGDLTGNVLGGALYRVAGAPLLFLIDGLSYLCAAVLSAMTSTRSRSKRETRTERLSAAVILRDLLESIRLLRRIEGATQLLIMALLVNCFAAPIFVLLPFHIERALGGDSMSYGITISGLLGGSLVGYALAGVIKLRRARAGIIIGAITTMCAAFSLLAVANTVVTAFAALALAGVAHGFWSIMFETALQAGVPREHLGRVFGVFGTLSGALFPIATALGGIAGDVLHQDTTLIFLVCSVIMTAVPMALAADRRFRSFMASLA